MLSLSLAANPKREQMQRMQQLKKIYIAMSNYDNDFGAFPEKLEALVTEGLIKADDLIIKDGDGELVNYVYYPGYNTAKDSRIVLIKCPAADEAHVIHLRLDGSVVVVPIEDKKPSEQAAEE